MSLAVGLAGVLGAVASASAAAPVTPGGDGAPIEAVVMTGQVAAMGNGLGPLITHEELVKGWTPGAFTLIAALAQINPSAGPGQTAPLQGDKVPDETLARDAGMSAGDTALRYLCPDKRYRNEFMQNLHVYAECGNGRSSEVLVGVNAFPGTLDGGAPTPPSSPPGGPTTPLPCGGVGFALSMVSVMTNVRNSNFTMH